MTRYRLWSLITGTGLVIAACGGSAGVSSSATPTPTVIPSATATEQITPTVPPLARPPGTLLFSAGLDGDPERYTVNVLGPDDIPAHPLLESASIEPRVLDAFPVWSPDGTRVAFIRIPDQRVTPALFVASADGTELREIDVEPAAFRDLAWSPDGKWLAFTSFEQSIAVVSVDGAEVRELVPADVTTVCHSPTWSPDGRRIAFVQWSDSDDMEIYSVNIDGTGLQALTDNQTIDTRPVWSPDGAAIAFESYHEGEPGIFVMNADGSEPRRLREDLGPAFRPAWSPDGSQIAISAYPFGSGDIHVVDFATGDSSTVTTTPDRDDVYPSWSPDGQWIAYLSHPSGPDPDESALSEIRVSAIDGTSAITLASDIAVEPMVFSAPAWQPVSR